MIRLQAEDFAWFYDRGGAYMTSVLVYDSLAVPAAVEWKPGLFRCQDR